LWDITAGKLLHELRDHTGPLTCMGFHPKELLMATGSADRYFIFVRFLRNMCLKDSLKIAWKF